MGPKQTELDKKLLQILQKEFPLEERPFLNIAKKLNQEEEQILDKVRSFHQQKIIRQISAIFNPASFGHRSSLFAFKVNERVLSQAVGVINQHKGVTHNYLRNNDYNLWFILVTTPDKDPIKEVEKMLRLCEVEDFLFLPAIRTFKISTVINLELEDEKLDHEETPIKDQVINYTQRDIMMVKALQEPLPLVTEPFKEIAKNLGIETREIFCWLKKMKKKGALRRFGALLKPNKAGYKVNVMVAWKIEGEKIEDFIKDVKNKPFVTHCYERKTYPQWDYNLYTMFHFRHAEEKSVISYLAEKHRIEKYVLLETIRELKKIRLKLFYD